MSSQVRRLRTSVKAASPLTDYVLTFGTVGLRGLLALRDVLLYLADTLTDAAVMVQLYLRSRSAYCTAPS